MHEIKKMLMDELYEYEEKAKRLGTSKISMQDLEKIHKLTDTVKNICKITMLEEEGENSEASEWMGEGRMYGTSYDGGGSSNARGRGSNARRDSRGRYSRDSNERGTSGENSYEQRSSYNIDGTKDQILDKLETMMSSADETQKEAIRRCMKDLERI